MGAGALELEPLEAVSLLPQAARASTATAVMPTPATPRTFFTANHSISNPGSTPDKTHLSSGIRTRPGEGLPYNRFI
jgi:hypothetical protein